MRTEKVIFSFIAVVIGLLVAGVAFYVYQSTKMLPQQAERVVTIKRPTPTPEPAVFLVVEKPEDEDVVETKTVTIAGKTIPEATIVINAEGTDQVVRPASNGNFSTTVTIGDGANQILITSIAPNGEETTIIRTITYSTETF